MVKNIMDTVIELEKGRDYFVVFGINASVQPQEVEAIKEWYLEAFEEIGASVVKMIGVRADVIGVQLLHAICVK